MGGGHRSSAKRRKIFLVLPLYFFAFKSTISRFGERFRDGQYSFVSFLFAFLLLMVPAPSHLQKWGRVPPCPMESAPLDVLAKSLLLILAEGARLIATKLLPDFAVERVHTVRAD